MLMQIVFLQADGNDFEINVSGNINRFTAVELPEKDGKVKFNINDVLLCRLICSLLFHSIGLSRFVKQFQSCKKNRGNDFITCCFAVSNLAFQLSPVCSIFSNSFYSFVWWFSKWYDIH